MVERTETDAEGTAIVAVPAEQVADAGFVTGFFVEVLDAAVVLRVVAAFTEVAVGDFSYLIEYAVLLLFLLVLSILGLAVLNNKQS